MASTAEAMDRVLRALLRLPGVVVDRLDGTLQLQDDVRPSDVHAVVRSTARHPEAYLALEPDLHYTAVDGHVLAWQHRGRTSFAVGGLNAPPGSRTAFLQAHRRQTQARGIVRQLVFPLRDDELADARRAGFSSVQVGIEAWLDLVGWTPRGNRFENLRQMRNRAQRRGVVVTEGSAQADGVELAGVHAAWLASRRPSWRMKLLVGSPCLDAPFDRRYFVARTAQRMEAFVTVLPGPPGVWGLDVMARRPDAVPGTMEALLVHVATILRDEGARSLSLGACPMAGVPWRWDRPVLSAAFRALFDTRLGNRIFGFRNLVRFKEKFRPRWEPVHLAAAPGVGVLALYRGCRMWGLY